MPNPPALCFDKNYRYLLDIEDKGPVAKVYKSIPYPDKDTLTSQAYRQQESTWWYLNGVRCYRRIHYEDVREK
jgi:hypothetical protein